VVPAIYSPKQPGAPVVDIPRGVPAAVATLLKSDLLFWLVNKIAPRVLIGTILATPPERFDEASEGERTRVRSMLAHILPVSARRLGLINDAMVISALGRFDLERITAPSLLITAEDDRYGTYAASRYTADSIEGARLLAFPEGGHAWIGHHAEVLEAIRTFLD
jgi:pimeloyl-ACP methyl ester carboxylesterase